MYNSPTKEALNSSAVISSPTFGLLKFSPASYTYMETAVVGYKGTF
jgi:hypothetical protein